MKIFPLNKINSSYLIKNILLCLIHHKWSFNNTTTFLQDKGKLKAYRIVHTNDVLKIIMALKRRLFMENQKEAKNLAIGTIPCQQWNQVYGSCEALREGTIFPELNKVFFMAVESQTMPEALDEKSRLIQKINEASFTVNDLTLYLDTHPQDLEALSLFKDKIAERKSAMKTFAEAYYPLTIDCIADLTDQNAGHWTWSEGAAPWEGDME